MQFGLGSRCFDSNVISKSQKSNSKARCLRYKCEKNKQLKIVIGGAEVLCVDNKAVPPPNINIEGTVTCANYEDVCLEEKCGGCSHHGKCRKLQLGNVQTIKCICEPGFTGENCET